MKKKIYKQWWFYFTIIILSLFWFAVIITPSSNTQENITTSSQESEEKQSRIEKEKEEKRKKEQEEKAQKEADKKAEKERKEKEKQEHEEQLKKQAQNVKQNFINSCKTYKYKDIARNPNNYKENNIKFTGKVIQVSEAWIGNGVTILIDVTKDEFGFYDDTIYCTYTYSSNESKILKDDIVTIYGTCKGDTTYTSVLGANITIPEVKIMYFTIDE